MFVLTKSRQKLILKLSNAIDIFVLSQCSFPISFFDLTAPAFLREPSCIERWKATLEEPQNQGALFESSEPAAPPVHRNRGIRRQRVKVQFFMIRPFIGISRKRQAIRCR